jgi:hypothetical protein
MEVISVMMRGDEDDMDQGASEYDSNEGIDSCGDPSDNSDNYGEESSP